MRRAARSTCWLASRAPTSGAPVSVLLYTLAPDKLLGWNRAPRAEERAFLPRRYADLPVRGRLTGRDNTANVEVMPARAESSWTWLIQSSVLSAITA